MSKKYKFLLAALLVALVGCDKKNPTSSSSSSNSVTSSDSTSSSVESSSSVVSSNSSDSTNSSSSSSSSSNSVTSSSSSSSEDSSSSTSSISSSSSEDSSSTTSSSSVESPSSTSSSSEPEPIKYEVVLPENLNGVSVTATNLEPAARENVRLFVKTLTPESRRVDEVKVNGVALEGSYSNVKDVMIYSFEMPVEDNAVVTVDVVDVWAVSVAEEVENYLALVGAPAVAAEGEVVSFKAASYAGYWFKKVAPVEEDVVLTEEAGVYSFTMPAHAVSFTAVTGNNVYKVEVEDADNNFTFKGFESYYSVGDTVEFTCVVADAKYATLTNVYVDGVALMAGEDGKTFSFVMPTHAVTVTADAVTRYRSVTFEGTEHFSLSVSTKNEDGEKVPADQVVFNTKLYVDYQEINTPHQFVMKNLKAKIWEEGDTLADAVNPKEITVPVSVDEDGENYITLNSDYNHIHYYIEEMESILKGTSLIGSYNGHKPYYQQNQTATIKDDGTATIGTASNLPLTKVEDNHYMGTTTSYSTKTEHHLYSDGADTLFYVNYSNSTSATLAKSGLFLFKKGNSQIDISKTYSYFSGPTTAYNNIPSTVETTFIHVTFADGEVREVYYNYLTKTVIWGVQPELVKGTDGKTTGDVVAIKDENDNVITRYELVKINGLSDGYQHACKIATPDAFVGTYTGAEGDLVLDGFGKAMLGEESLSYTIQDANKKQILLSNDVLVELGEGTYEVKENVTFDVIAGKWETDESGDYGANEVVVTVNITKDGTLTINAPESTSTALDNQTFEFVRTEELYGDLFYVFNNTTHGEIKVNSGYASSGYVYVTYDEAGLYGDVEYYKVVNQSVVGQTYSGTFDDTLLSFKFLEEEKVEYKIGSSSRNATFVVNEETGVITVTDSNAGTITLTRNGDTLTVTNVTSSSYSDKYNYLGYSISLMRDTVLTVVE